ncbi:hypothetical protein V2J09_011473 [Rumex salicifolius]
MPTMKSFIEVSPDSHFSIHNLPYGIFKPSPTKDPRPGVAIGDYIIDLLELDRNGLFDGPILCDAGCFKQTTLNKFISMGRPAWTEARECLQNLLSVDTPWLRDNHHLQGRAVVPMSQVEMLLPVEIGDYTDFYASPYHAKNCTSIVHDADKPLNENWLSLPVAYHGRASSVVPSGTDIVRPKGQGAPAGNSPPYFGPSLKLDFELEMGAIVGTGNELGKPININDAKDHIFGLVLLNDWSARDIQRWEMVPLGPFLGKSFATSISPWVVTLDALEPFACDIPEQNPSPLPYLTDKVRRNYDISLEVSIKPAGEKASTVVTKSNFKHLYWTLSQQLAHHTVNGCNLRTGDLLGTGTLSGPTPESMGCLFEKTWGGQKSININGKKKIYLEDGDEVTLTGVCKGNGYNVGFGTCTGKILPSV